MTNKQAIEWFESELEGGKCSDHCEQCNANEIALNTLRLTSDIPLEELETLITAYKDGRAVILPCKVGTRVDKYNAFMRGVISGVIERLRYWDLGSDKGYVAEIKWESGSETVGSLYIGKTVFLTPEAAALERG